MKASPEKSSSTTAAATKQTTSQPFFAKAGRGNFFEPAATDAPAVQMKMDVDKPGDKLEQEADEMAGKVMRMPEPDREEKRELQQARSPAIQRAAFIQRQEEPADIKKIDEEIEGRRIFLFAYTNAEIAAHAKDNGYDYKVYDSVVTKFASKIVKSTGGLDEFLGKELSKDEIDELFKSSARPEERDKSVTRWSTFYSIQSGDIRIGFYSDLDVPPVMRCFPPGNKENHHPKLAFVMDLNGNPMPGYNHALERYIAWHGNIGPEIFKSDLEHEKTHARQYIDSRSFMTSVDEHQRSETEAYEASIKSLQQSRLRLLSP